MVRERQVGTHVEQGAEGVGDVEVEVEEIFPAMLFKEGSYVVGIIFEERGLAIRRHESLPVEMTPVAVVGDAYVAHGTFHAVITLYRHGEGLRTIGRGNDATVAVGLLDKVVMLLYDAMVTVELLIPLNGAEIGGGK